jgi:hypothetical protein
MKLDQLVDATIAEAVKCIAEGVFDVGYDSLGEKFAKDDVIIRVVGNDVIVSITTVVKCDNKTMDYINSCKKAGLEKKLEELKEQQTKLEQQLSDLK